MITRDSAEFMGEVAKWLKSAPEITHDYGAFYITNVTLSFDGEALGRFINEDPDWIYEEQK